MSEDTDHKYQILHQILQTDGKWKGKKKVLSLQVHIIVYVHIAFNHHPTPP